MKIVLTRILFFTFLTFACFEFPAFAGGEGIDDDYHFLVLRLLTAARNGEVFEMEDILAQMRSRVAHQFKDLPNIELERMFLRVYKDTSDDQLKSLCAQLKSDKGAVMDHPYLGPLARSVWILRAALRAPPQTSYVSLNDLHAFYRNAIGREAAFGQIVRFVGQRRVQNNGMMNLVEAVGGQFDLADVNFIIELVCRGIVQFDSQELLKDLETFLHGFLSDKWSKEISGARVEALRKFPFRLYLCTPDATVDVCRRFWFDIYEAGHRNQYRENPRWTQDERLEFRRRIHLEDIRYSGYHCMLVNSLFREAEDAEQIFSNVQFYVQAMNVLSNLIQSSDCAVLIVKYCGYHSESLSQINACERVLAEVCKKVPVPPRRRGNVCRSLSSALSKAYYVVVDFLHRFSYDYGWDGEESTRNLQQMTADDRALLHRYIVHRDLRPQNLLVDASGGVQLDASRSQEADPRSTQTDVVPANGGFQPRGDNSQPQPAPEPAMAPSTLLQPLEDHPMREQFRPKNDNSRRDGTDPGSGLGL